MSNIYEVFNVTNDHELSKVFDKLDLSYNEMTNIDYIVESMNKDNARTKILELMAGSADGNYEVCLEQFSKIIKPRVLKEESGLNLNQVMELNQLVELVASKLNANQEQCMNGVYNIISQKAGDAVAKAFIGMVQQSVVNQSSLKFNTDLVVSGKNLAQTIYALKNEIEIFCNSIKKEESEKEEKINESVLMERLFPELDYEKYEWLLDVTANGGRANAYTKWLGNLIVNGNVNPFKNDEYFHDFKDKIDSHKKLKSAGKVKDIMQYSSWNEMVTDVNNQLENHKFNSDFDKKAKEGFKIIATEGDLILGEVNNREAAIKYGKGTKWCTSSVNDDRYYKKYKCSEYEGLGDNNLFYLIDKNNSENNLGISAYVSKSISNLNNIKGISITIFNSEDKEILDIGIDKNRDESEYNYSLCGAEGKDIINVIEKLKNPTINFVIHSIFKYYGINYELNSQNISKKFFDSKITNRDKTLEPIKRLSHAIMRLCNNRVIKMIDAKKYIPLLAKKFGIKKIDEDKILEYINSILPEKNKYNPHWGYGKEYMKTSIKPLEELFKEYLKTDTSKTITESYESYKHIIQELDKAVDDVSDINILKSIADRVDTLLGRVKNMNEANEIASLKTAIETKMNSLLDVKPALDECCLATQVAQDVCGEDTFNGLLDSVKPTVINITVNKEDNGILPCVDNCCAEPCCDCNNNCCCEPCCDCGDDCAAPIVQPMNFEPTAIDAPILRKPNSAEVTSAITALSSHSNDIKSDSRENNLENLQTINTLLGQISNYFNTLLGESFDIGDKITNKKGLNDEVMEITDKYEENGKEVYDVKVDLGNGIKTVSKGLDAKDLEDKNEKIEGLWDGEEDEQLDEETVYDHSWFEVEGQKYPKRTKNGVEGLPIKETCSAGACCAASVATVPSKPKKAKAKPRKQESFDVSLFKESVRNDCPATLTINDKKVSYKLVEGKGYLYIDNGIVKTLDKDVMLETIDDVYNNCLDIEILEGFNAYELNILLEDGINDDMGDIDSVTTITPEEKKEAQQELDKDLAQKPNLKINVVSSENNGEIHQNQEFLGIDDHDESNKKYIVKDPATGKITVADYNQIKIAEN